MAKEMINKLRDVTDLTYVEAEEYLKIVVMCPATPDRRLKNGCSHTCSHFHPHLFCHDATDQRDSCLQITGRIGEVICPSCIEATEELKVAVYTDAVTNRMTRGSKGGKRK